MDMERASKALQTVESVPLDEAGYAVEELEDVVREVLDAPRMWWCKTDGFSEERSRRCWTFTHDGCGWVRVVKEANQ